MKKLLIFLVIFSFLFSGCTDKKEDTKANTKETHIFLSDEKITVDGQKIANDKQENVYSAEDIVFYKAGQPLTYGEGTINDEHLQEEADAHTVVHITKPGRYVLSGTLSYGQIAVDLGKNSQKDPEAVVTLILNGVDITCEVAPAIIFYNVYECGEKDEDKAKKDVDTFGAGANVIIADDTKNNVNGSYVAKIYKSCELGEDGTEVIKSETLHKYDGAFYSKMSMNISGGKKGNGILNIRAENEGLDSELHLTINGGIINITSGNDGINTNEDNVSVTTVNSGTVNIVCDGSTGEGDGIDSNGWIVINGGKITSQACATSGDAGVDSDKGIHINGGTLMASGNMIDPVSDSKQTFAVFRFEHSQEGNKTYSLKNSDGKVCCTYTPENEFSCLIFSNEDLTEGDYTLWQEDVRMSAVSGINMRGKRPEMPQGEKPQMPQGEKPTMPQGEKPQMPQGKRPQMPQGEMPGGEGGGFFFGAMRENDMEKSDILKFSDGGNEFFVVSPASEEQ